MATFVHKSPDQPSPAAMSPDDWPGILQPLIVFWRERRSRGLIYDFAMGSIAIFLAGLLLLNFLAGEHARGYRAASGQTVELNKSLLAWQEQVRQERQLLAKQWMLLESDLAEIPGSTPANSTQPEQIRSLHTQIAAHLERWSAELAEKQEQLAQLFPGGSTQTGFDPARQHQANVLTQRLQELMRSQQSLATQLKPDHPRLQAGVAAMQETQRQLDQLRSSPPGDLAGSPVRVVQNQFIHNAGLTTAKPAPKPVEQFNAWSRETQKSLAEIRNQLATAAKTPFASPAQLRQLRDTAIMFSKQLESWEQHAQLPPSLAGRLELGSGTNSQGVALPIELSSGSLWLLLFAALACGGVLMWFGANYPARSASPEITKPKTKELTVAEITNTLGSAPMAILPSLESPAPKSESLIPAAPLDRSPVPKSLPRRACELLVWSSLAATLALIFVHDRFGGWVQENPLTAWGRWWGGE